jgi:glycosyltransferase involved in cell wall biosynthesis
MLAERRLLARAEVKAAVSGPLAVDYARTYGWNGIATVHNGVDCRTLSELADARHTSRGEFGYSDDDFLIVTPARFIASKGHQFLLDALEMLRRDHEFEPKAFICGVGPTLEQVRKDVARRYLHRQVTVSPSIPHETLFPLIAAADAVVLPSLAETFGIAAAEAMAVGATCVLTDISGFRELTAGVDCALIVPPADAEALAAAIWRLRSEQGLARELGLTAREHVCGRFDIGPCATQWIEILGALPRA